MKQRIIFLMLAMSCMMQSFAAKANKAVSVTVNGETRTYWLYVPDKVNKITPTPLVVSLHGAGGNPIGNAGDRCPMGTDVADSEGFIVVYPQGKQIFFPVFGGSVNGWDASGEENADVDFIKAVIEDVAAGYAVDRNRIYCCGFSNGGMMTYALTNTCSVTFAAFASISGFPLNEFHFRHTGARPVPFLHIHGKSDDFVKYSCMPIIVDEMVARIGANPVPKKTTVSGKYDKSVYEAGEGSFPYVYYEMDGMFHSAYTGNTPEGNSGKTMWKHFKQYTLDTPCDRTLKWRPRLEEEGYAPKEHGWYVNSSTYVLLFGRDQHKSDNSDNNVYRSFQLKNGIYKLCFHAEGEEGKTVTARIKKLAGKRNTVLNSTAKVGGDVCLYFKVAEDDAEGWGEYTFSISRESSSDVITITDLGLYTATEEELISHTGISFPENTFPYTGVAPEVTWTNNVEEEGYTVAVTLPEFHTEVGTYQETVPVTFTKGDFSFSGEFPYEYTIQPASLTAKVNDASRAYGEENPAFEITYTGFVGDETESVLTTLPVAETTATIDSDAGTYPITLQGGEAKNYTITYEEGTLTITQAEQTIQWEQDLPSLTVGDEVELLATASSELPITYTIDEASSAEINTSEGKTLLTATTAGEMIITATQEGNTNYLAAEPVKKTVTILPQEDTSVEQVNTLPLQIQPTQSGISVTGAPAGASIRIYTPSGALFATATMSGSRTDIAIPTKGTYLVKVGTATKKLKVEK